MKSKILILVMAVIWAGSNCSFAQEVANSDNTAVSTETSVGQEQDNGAAGLPGSFVMNIKPSEKDSSLFSIELRDTPLLDLFRLIARDYNLNLIVDTKVSGKMTATLNNISIEEALNTIVEMNNLKIEKKGALMIIKPNFMSKTFVLQFVRLSDIVEVQTTTTTTAVATPSGASASGAASSSTGSPSRASETRSSSFTGKNDFQKCLSDDGYVIPNTQSNSFIVYDYPENIQKVEEYVKMADRGREKRIIKLNYISANDLLPEVR